MLSYDQQLVSDIAHFVKGTLITSFPMINRGWVTLHILWKAFLIHLFLWPTASEWHYTFCERQSHHTFPYDQQEVSNNSVMLKAVSSHLFLWLTGSEWHFTFYEKQSHHMFSYDWQWVSDMHILWKIVLSHHSLWVTLHILVASSHLFLWSTACVWHCTVCKSNLITSFPTTNRKWVTLHVVWEAVSSHLFIWQTASEFTHLWK